MAHILVCLVHPETQGMMVNEPVCVEACTSHIHMYEGHPLAFQISINCYVYTSHVLNQLLTQHGRSYTARRAER